MVDLFYKLLDSALDFDYFYLRFFKIYGFRFGFRLFSLLSFFLSSCLIYPCSSGFYSLLLQTFSISVGKLIFEQKFYIRLNRIKSKQIIIIYENDKNHNHYHQESLMVCSLFVCEYVCLFCLYGSLSDAVMASVATIFFIHTMQSDESFKMVEIKTCIF